MKTSRAVLLALSSAVALLLVGGGVAVAVGARDGAYRQVRLFSEVLSLILDQYVEEVNADRLLAGAYRGLLGGLGARGAYLTPEEVEAWRKGPQGQAADPGIGVLKAFGSLQVVSVAPGSPAEEAGIVRGDQVRRVDGKLVRDVSLDQGVRLLRGSPGSSVRLSLIRPREGYRREEIEVRRAARSGPAYRLEAEQGIGVLTVFDPRQLRPEGLAADLDGIRSRGVEKLLLDLRNVADAGPRDVAPFAELFTSGPLFRMTDRSGRTIEALEGRRPKPAWAGDVAILVNSGTADGAEALARLLKGRRQAVIFGEPTYGLGAESRLLELPDGSGLLIPAFLWETAEGATWDGEGLTPDRVVRAEGKPEEADSEQLRRVIEELSRQEAEPEAKAA